MSDCESFCPRLPYARKRYHHLVAACAKCNKLYVCRYKSYLTYSIRGGGYYYWDIVKKEKKK